MPEKGAPENYSEWKSSIGIAIKQRRERANKSLGETASRAQISPELLRSIESGKGYLTLQQLFRLSQALEVPISQLLLGTGSESTAAEAREFMSAFKQIKDPELKDQISSLVSTMVQHLTKEVPKS